MLMRVYIWLNPVAAPLGIDIFGGVRKALDGFVYNAAFSLAGVHWGLLRAFIMMGHIIQRVNLWLTDQAFAPLIAANSASLQVAFRLTFVVALLVLGITYLIAVFIRLDVVNFQSAMIWYVAGALFFTLGPSLYQGMNDFRERVASAFYVTTLQGIQSQAGGTFDLGAVQTADLGLAPLCDYLGPYLPGATYANSQQVDGLDVAMAYLHADGVDVMGYMYPVIPAYCPPHLRDPDPVHGGRMVASVPTDWLYEDSYFDFLNSPGGFDWDDEDVRAAAIAMGWQAHGRMLTAWPLVLFGIVEQTVYLLLTIAMGITFMIFGVAVFFGFFRRTEGIANAVVNQWIELIVQTVVIGMIQALVVGFFLMGTASGNALVVLAVGLVCLVLMVIVLWSGVKAVWNSLNRLFDALGQGAGQVFIRPGQATTMAAAGAGYGAGKVGETAGAASAALTGMRALQQGATRMQAAGLSFGGSSALSGAMRAIARTPGLRESGMGQAAEQFLEGASARTISRSVPAVVQHGAGLNLRGGIALLTDRNPEAEGQTMLLPAFSQRLARWTTPEEQPPRMGRFTPDPPPDNPPQTASPTPTQSTIQTERTTARQEMVGEELEQHITEQTQQSGMMQVQGVQAVSGALADALRLIQQDRTDAGGTKRDNLDTLTAGRYVAEAMGVTPTADRPPLGGQDLARMGLFLQQALRLGLSPRQTAGLIRDVKDSPDGQLRDSVRETLVQVVKGDGRSWEQARRDVVQIENQARQLPDALAAYGQVPIKPEVSITVNTPAAATAYDEAAQKQAALEGQ